MSSASVWVSWMPATANGSAIIVLMLLIMLLMLVVLALGVGLQDVVSICVLGDLVVPRFGFGLGFMDTSWFRAQWFHACPTHLCVGAIKARCLVHVLEQPTYAASDVGWSSRTLLHHTLTGCVQRCASPVWSIQNASLAVSLLTPLRPNKCVAGQ